MPLGRRERPRRVTATAAPVMIRRAWANRTYGIAVTMTGPAPSLYTVRSTIQGHVVA